MDQFSPESKWEKKEMHPSTFIFQFGTLGYFCMTFAKMHSNFFTKTASSIKTVETRYNIQLSGEPPDALTEVKCSMSILSLSH